jgi:hypothetical protein
MDKGQSGIGKRYYAKWAELTERIREGTISALETTVEEERIARGIRRFTCYFCNMNISGTMYVLEEVKHVKGTKDSKAPYYIDDECYHDAKRNQYFGDLKLSLN